jgi:hypothetical protein
VDARLRHETALGRVCAGSVEPSIAQHNPVEVEHHPLVLFDRAAHAGRPEGDALGEHARGARRPGRGDQVARALGADPVVAFDVERQPLHVVGEVGQLVHHELGLERRHRAGERIDVVDVA